jgi:L-fucose isomerase-like protein
MGGERRLQMTDMTLGVIIGNRDFFPDVLVTTARAEVLAVLAQNGVRPVILDEAATKRGAVETWEDAKKCAELFKSRRDQIDGILVILPNFGDEKGVAEAIKLSGLQTPILVQAYPDDLDRFDLASRRDSFCGKISVCNNLRQYRLPFSLTDEHTVEPGSAAFQADLTRFLGVCRVVKGLRGARLGAIGARPNAFNTVRYSEKLLQGQGISVNTLDLSEVLGRADRLSEDDARVRERITQIRGYVPTGDTPHPALARMARMAVVIDDWMAGLDLTATALQCWTSVQLNYGVNVCTLMSMMSDRLMPSACEVDVTGVASMYALQLASNTPSALVDWNNSYGGDRNKCVLFHCGNWAKSFLPDAEMEYAHVLSTTLGAENTRGAISGRVPAGPLTFARISTDDQAGAILAYVGEGRFTDDPLNTFGARAVVEVPQLQKLLRYICRHGFEHHTAVSMSQCAASVAEAFETYLGWDVHRHNVDPA